MVCAQASTQAQAKTRDQKQAREKKRFEQFYHYVCLFHRQYRVTLICPLFQQRSDSAWNVVDISLATCAPASLSVNWLIH